MSFEDIERFRSIDGVMRNSVAEKNHYDKEFARQTDELLEKQKNRQAKAFVNRRKWLAEPYPDQELLKFKDVRVATVVAVNDGNSMDLIDDVTGQKIRVRLYGIDAPELQQEHGAYAKKFLESKVCDKKVRFRVQSEKFAYRVMVWIDALNINLIMVEYGHAMNFLEYEDEYSQGFMKSELDAKLSRLGMWKYSTPPHPAWEQRLNLLEYRMKEKEKSQDVQGLSLFEKTKIHNDFMDKYDEDIKVWRQKWYVKIFAPLGLASFLKPPKFGG